MYQSLNTKVFWIECMHVLEDSVFIEFLDGFSMLWQLNEGCTEFLFKDFALTLEFLAFSTLFHQLYLQQLILFQK